MGWGDFMDKNTDFELFDEYTEYITRRIMSNKKKAEVRDEYYSHLLEEYERYTYLGKSHAEAQACAIESMGDREIVKEQFGELYSVIPFKYMKSSLNLIMWGMLLSSFQINIGIDGLTQIVGFIGSALLLFGLLKIRKTDVKLNIAFFMNVGIGFLGVVGAHIGRTLIEPAVFSLALTFTSIALTTVMYAFLFAGINSLCVSLNGDGLTRPKLKLGFIFYCLFELIFFAALSGVVIFAFIAPIFLILSIWQLRNARKVLANANEEFELKTVITIGEKAVYCVLIFAFAVTPIISMLAVAGSQPRVEVYNPTDTSYTADEVNTVKLEMLSLGMPEDILDDLPDSEIMKYKGAIYLEKTCGQKYGLSNNNLALDFSSYIFFFPNAEARSLICADIDDESVLKYRNGLYLKHSSRDWAPMNTGGEDEFYLALCEKDGKTVSSEIIAPYEPEIYNFDSVEGFEFKFPRGSVSRRAYVSNQIYIQSVDKEHRISLIADFIFESQPLAATRYSVNNVAQHEFGQSSNKMFVNTNNFKDVAMGHSFDFKPEYTEIIPEE